MPILTREALQKFAPRPKERGAAQRNWDAYVDVLVTRGDELLADAAIDTALELQHLMAQIGHECEGFTLLWESGAYLHAEVLFNTFGEGHHSAKMSMAECRMLVSMRGEERDRAIFERAYGLGNPHKARELGNTEPGDGYRYRGYGPMQITGKADHIKYLEGDTSPYGALRAALREWNAKGCNTLAAHDDIKTITQRINGGHNGYAERKALLAKAKRIWPTFPQAETITVTPKAMAAVSQKAALAQNMITAGKAAFAAGTVAEAIDPLAKASADIGGLNTVLAGVATLVGFMREHLGLVVIAFALCLLFFGGKTMMHTISDYIRNAYMPSGGEPETTTTTIVATQTEVTA